MKYIDISSYKAMNLGRHVVETPFKGQHLVLINPISTAREIILYADGVLEILPGFMHDWASGPTRDTKGTMIPAMEHDALFRLLRTGQVLRFTWKDADKFLQKRLVEYGVNKVRAWWWYWGRQVPGVARGKQAKPCKEPAYIVKRVKV